MSSYSFSQFYKTSIKGKAIGSQAKNVYLLLTGVNYGKQPLDNEQHSYTSKIVNGKNEVSQETRHDILELPFETCRSRLAQIAFRDPKASAAAARRLAVLAGLAPPDDLTDPYDVMTWAFRQSMLCPPHTGELIPDADPSNDTKEDLIRQFHTCASMTAEDRGRYADGCLSYYRQRFAKADPSVVVRNLIYRPEWVVPKDCNEFMPLSAVKTDWPGPRWTGRVFPVPCLPEPSAGYVKNRQRHSPDTRGKLFNADLVGFAGAEGDIRQGNLKLNVSLGKYFTFMDTCEVLVYETARAALYWEGSDPFSPETLPDAMPARHASIDLFDASNRFAGVGVDAVTLLYHVQDESTPLMLLHQRGERAVAENAGTLSVIPAGSWTPVGGDDAAGFDGAPVNTVYREFAEELLKVPEAEQLGVPQLLDSRLMKQPVVLLGFGFEPLNTKLELMAALQMDLADEDTRALLGGNADRAGLEAFFRANANYEGTLRLIPFTQDYLRQYRNDIRSAPVLREIMTILEEHYDRFAALP